MVETKNIFEEFEKYAECDDLNQMVTMARKGCLMRAVNQKVWKEMVDCAKKAKDKVLDLFR